MQSLKNFSVRGIGVQLQDLSCEFTMWLRQCSILHVESNSKCDRFSVSRWPINTAGLSSHMVTSASGKVDQGSVLGRVTPKPFEEVVNLG